MKQQSVKQRMQAFWFTLIGVLTLLAIWQVTSWLLTRSDSLAAFDGLRLQETLPVLWQLTANGSFLNDTISSLNRVLQGIGWAALIGIPVGAVIGLSTPLRQILYVSMQFLRMVSPLAWMPIAVLIFASWQGAIVFIVAIASIWPIIFSVSSGIHKLNPMWFMLANNLGANPLKSIRYLLLPAIAQDILLGFRQAVGVSWIVLVPAELLGVTSGLGYAINDSRDALEYDRLMATIVLIGCIGMALDKMLEYFVKRSAWQNI